jgi:hypothetical protein
VIYSTHIALTRLMMIPGNNDDWGAVLSQHSCLEGSQ